MRKSFHLLLIGIIFCSCIKKEKEKIDYPITKLELINKAEYYYSGLESINISDKNEINNIQREIDKLRNDLSKEIVISVNYGYVDILLKNDKGDKQESFSIVFTEYYGDIIRYGGKHYYRNQILVDLIKDKLKMWENPRPE